MESVPPKQVKGDTVLAILLFILCCILAFLDDSNAAIEIVGASLP